MYLFDENFEGQSLFRLSEEEAHHALNVLRLGSGDKAVLLNGRGLKAEVQIEEAHKKSCTVSIRGQVDKVQENPAALTIGICPTKNIDRMEWFTEKAVEAGVRNIYFIQSRRTERSKINLERLQKIAVSALKQSGRVWLPEMHGLMNLATFMEQSRSCHHSWIAHCEDASKSTLKEAILKSGQHRVLIGPEGDFHQDEIREAMQAGFLALDLGNTRLRTETAALLVSFAFSDCLK